MTPIKIPLPLAVLLLVATTPFTPAQTLPNTQPLTGDDPLDVRMMAGAHRFIERKINKTTAENPPSDERRARLAFLIGANNRDREPHTHLVFPPPDIPVQMQRIGDDTHPAIAIENAAFTITRVRWPVLDRVHGEGLLLEPTVTPRAHAIVVPDANQPPETLAGLTADLHPEHQLARRLAEQGVRVLIPTLINRHDIDPEGKINQSNREWIYRQAFHMGRHIIGYEIDKIRAAIDWLEQTSQPETPLAIAGWGEAQQHAIFTAAIDPRIDVTLLSGQWQTRGPTWRQPIYRNFWAYTAEIGDPAVARLIEPRSLIFESSTEPTIDPKRDKAMPLATPASDQPAYRQDTFQKLLTALDIHPPAPVNSSLPTAQNLRPAIAARHTRQLRELDDYTQRLARDSASVRDTFYLNQALPALTKRRWFTEAVHDTTPVADFTQHTEKYREILHRDILGRFDDTLLPPNPRSRLIRETDTATSYDIVLDVAPDLFAWGILILPKNLPPDTRHPVVVVQHGRNGLPQKILDGGYNNIAQKLIDRGYIVFAPHNLYRGEDDYRWLDRKANTLGKTLFSFLVLQHDQITRWLAALPQVDGNKIAFYGNSYGGESAVRIPTVLTRYALSICASDFNDWTRKVTDTHNRHSFMRTIEWEMPYFDMGNTFSYAEMAYLMVSRPFMVERGHHDLVAPDHWVAAEYTKVRLVYDQLGIPDRTAITYFQGGHTMRGEATLKFLDKHLR